MNKQDCNGVRNAQDLERKYDFASLLGLKKNIEIQIKNLTKVENELNNFINSTIGNIENLQEQIDGKITTWYYEGTPTLNNNPANQWGDEEKEEHIGDLYYDKLTGYCYRFQYDNFYNWNKIVDQDVVNSLAIANSAKDTADSKRQIFIVQPKTPYDNGDLWISENEIYICQISRQSGSFEASDWINNLKYTDNTVANAIIDELGGTTTTVLHGQVLQITDKFAKYTDLATGGSTTIAGENITTGSIKSKNYVQNSKGMKINLENGTIDTKNTKWDEYGNIKLSNGATIITDKGLMSNLQFCGNNGEFVILGMDYNEMNNEFQKYNISIYADIPENFTIEKAYITIIHQPCLWNDVNYGYTRNIAIYKATLNSKFASDWRSDFSLETENTLTQLTKIFSGDKNIWQPSTPSSSNSKIEVKQTIDISSYLAKGLNKFIIQTSDNLPTPESDYNINLKTAMQRSGRGIAVIDIYGFIKV